MMGNVPEKKTETVAYKRRKIGCFQKSKCQIIKYIEKIATSLAARSFSFWYSFLGYNASIFLLVITNKLLDVLYLRYFH